MASPVAAVRLTRTVQLLAALAAYLLVTAVLKSTLDLSKRTCCILAIGAPPLRRTCAAVSRVSACIKQVRLPQPELDLGSVGR